MKAEAGGDALLAEHLQVLEISASLPTPHPPIGPYRSHWETVSPPGRGSWPHPILGGGGLVGGDRGRVAEIKPLPPEVSLPPRAPPPPPPGKVGESVRGCRRNGATYVPRSRVATSATQVPKVRAGDRGGAGSSVQGARCRRTRGGKGRGRC